MKQQEGSRKREKPLASLGTHAATGELQMSDCLSISYLVSTRLLRLETDSNRLRAEEAKKTGWAVVW